jgi:hypothetical protein
MGYFLQARNGALPAVELDQNQRPYLETLLKSKLDFLLAIRSCNIESPKPVYY